MKNTFLAISLLLTVLVSNAQEPPQVKEDKAISQNEIKLNALFMIVGAFDFSYERLLNEESGVGIEVFVPFDADIDVNYYVSPYYRLYFGNKYASGFYLEGFGMLNSMRVYNLTYYDHFASIVNETSKDETNFALGIGLGGKWITKTGFVGELGFGIGRNLINSDYENDFVAKIGITIGYRF